MKRKQILFMVLLISGCILCSCSSTNDLPKDISEKLLISIEPATVTKDFLKDIAVKITNNSEETIIAGEEYTLQIIDEANQFKNIPLNIIQNDLGIPISSGNNHVFHYDLSEFVTADVDTVYYIKKSVYINQTEYELTSSFSFVGAASSKTVVPPKANKDIEMDDNKPTVDIDLAKQIDSQKKGDSKMGNKPTVDIDSAKQIDSQKTTDNILSLSDQIEMRCTQDDSGNINVIITNNTDYEIMAGEEYQLQKFNRKKLEDIPISMIWNDFGVSIPAGESYTFQYDVSAAIVLERDISYRIIKSVYYNQTKMDLTCDFQYK